MMMKDGRDSEGEAHLTATKDLQGMGDSRYRLLFNHVSDAVFVHYGPDEHNLPGKFIEVNDVACRRLGYTREELLKMSPPDIDAPETVPKLPAMMEKLFRDKQALWEGTHIGKDGRRIPVEINNVLFHLDDKPLILSTVRDITERKQAQEALQKKAEELRFIAENVGDIIWQMNPQICFTYVSPAVRRILGYEPSEVVGRNLFTLLTPAGAEMITPVWVEWYAHLAKGIQRDELLFEMEAVHRDGRSVWMEVQARPLVDTGGRVIQYHGVTRDITQRRQAERERRQLTERLNRAEKMESLGILAGGVAHDLNNVLGVIVGYAELMMGKMPPGEPLHKYAAGIMKSSEKSAAIIQDLLALARRGVAVCEVIDLNRVIAEYFQTPEFERLKAYHQQVTFTADLAGNLMSIKGSPVHIGKTIMNLMSNAAESIAAQGSVTIKTENRYVDKPVTGYDEIQRGDYVVLAVSDNGGGISSEDIGKIFEPFYTKKVMGRSGTGLGLAIVWGTVKDHRGYIDVQSEEGKGSTFSVYFPATREELNRDNKTVESDSYLGNGESILVVDDVEDQRELAIAMLAKLGYEAQTVSSGREAVAYLRSHRVDLVVIDMIMDPGMDGLDTYREIVKIQPGQKAIIVSGFSETDRVKQAQELGAGAYVPKPYILEKIGLAIRNELDR
ncbi:MAG: hybrid sensor histidine kinase/response regulator [Syntrophales bacterium]